MHHLFAGLPVRQLGLSPYTAAASEAMAWSAADLGLQVAPGAEVYLPPNIAGFVGGDHVAMLLATGIDNTQKNVIAIDIGTNTEITLAAGGRYYCCSCASGPAFEGARIRDGMRAAAGAVERIWISGEKIRLQVIGGGKPTGICGSGILDAAAEMYRAGVIDPFGRWNTGHPLGAAAYQAGELVLASPGESGSGQAVGVTRRDVAEIQLAKAAIRTGVEVLLSKASLAAAEIDEFIVAGAFGTYLDIGSAVRIGMFPPLQLERFKQVGNAAGAGARQLLVAKPVRQRAKALASRLEYVELVTQKSFQDLFYQYNLLGNQDFLSRMKTRGR
jgi:uncharacterized 2Fe-2S/4Fe-4S cluster protein (DUF4445 family)